MTMPPPKRRTMPPPPRKAVDAYEDKLIISPDLSRLDIECATWVHGGYPQVPWAQAVRELMRKCQTTAIGYVCVAAFAELDGRLAADCDLTAQDRAANYQKDLK